MTSYNVKWDLANSISDEIGRMADQIMIDAFTPSEEDIKRIKLFRKQKIRRMIMTGIVIAAIAAVVGIASIFIFKKDDGPVEQAAEQIIKAETGLDVDLSAEDKEKK